MEGDVEMVDNSVRVGDHRSHQHHHHHHQHPGNNHENNMHPNPEHYTNHSIESMTNVGSSNFNRNAMENLPRSHHYNPEHPDNIPGTSENYNNNGHRNLEGHTNLNTHDGAPNGGGSENYGDRNSSQQNSGYPPSPPPGVSVTCPCLVCGHQIKTADSQRKLNVENFTKQFAVFADYMDWDPAAGEHEFDFETEAFPFCQHCQTVLFDVFKLNEQLQNITKNINELILNASEKIISSYTKTKDPPLLPETDVKGGRTEIYSETGSKIYYNNTKVQFFRNVTLTRYLPSVRLKTEEDDDDDDEEAEDEDMDDEGDDGELMSDSPVSSPPSATNVLQESNQADEILMPFSLSAHEHLSAYVDEEQSSSSPEVVHIETVTGKYMPLARANIHGKRWQKSAPKYRKRKEYRHFVRKVSDNKLVYRGFTFEKLDNGQLKCCHCYYFTPRRHNITMHIARAHARKGKRMLKRPSGNFSFAVKMDENTFHYKGFQFEVRDGTYFCCHCNFSAPVKTDTMEHITRFHRNEWPQKKKPVKGRPKGRPKGSRTTGRRIGRPPGSKTKKKLQVEVLVDGNLELEEANTRKAIIESLYSGKFKDRIRQKDYRNFIVDEKYPIQLNGHDKWVCLTCHVIFSARFNLERHILNTCKGDNPDSPVLCAEDNDAPEEAYRCEPCGISYTKEMYLQRHMKKLHADGLVEPKAESPPPSTSYGRGMAPAPIQGKATRGAAKVKPIGTAIINPRPETFLEKRISGILNGKLKNHLQQISEIGFIFDGVHYFELSSAPANTWICLLCQNHYIGQNGIEGHVLVGCKGELLEKISEHEYIYQDYRIKLGEVKGSICQHCQHTSKKKEDTAVHIYTKHLSGGSLKRKVPPPQPTMPSMDRSHDLGSYPPEHSVVGYDNSQNPHVVQHGYNMAPEDILQYDVIPHSIFHPQLPLPPIPHPQQLPPQAHPPMGGEMQELSEVGPEDNEEDMEVKSLPLEIQMNELID